MIGSEFVPHMLIRLGIFYIFTVVPWMVPAESAVAEEGRKVIVCSTTQVADFAQQIVGDRWEVVCVLGAAEDPHSYEVGVDDAVAVARADLCAENGWNLEGHDWMQRLARQASKPIVTCIVGVEPLQAKEGDRDVRDPHAWMDPENAAKYVENLYDAICRIDPENTDEYKARKTLYLRQLILLEGWIKNTIGSIPANRRLLVTHHDAFEYFCRKFNFQTASPLGWSTAELTEVTATRRQAVVNQIRELGVQAIFVETSANDQLIRGIARDAGVEIGGTLYSDAMGPPGSAAEGYIGMMRENVLTIVKALKP